MQFVLTPMISPPELLCMIVRAKPRQVVVFLEVALMSGSDT